MAIHELIMGEELRAEQAQGSDSPWALCCNLVAYTVAVQPAHGSTKLTMSGLTGLIFLQGVTDGTGWGSWLVSV